MREKYIMINQSEYKSKNVTFTIERKPDCIIEYKVTSSPELVKKARFNAVKAVSKEVSIPGFRKGKAPDSLIVKKFPMPLNEQWQKAIADETFIECQKLVKIPLISGDAQISFKIEEHSIEEGAKIVYLLETEPEVPEIDLSILKLQEAKREAVDAKKIELSLRDIQMFFAKWEKVSGRVVKEGDYAVVDIDIIESHPPQKGLQNTRFEVAKEKMATWMHDLIVGMGIGDSKEGVSQPDNNAHEKEQTLPPKKVRIILKSIEKPNIPPIDDILAQKIGAKTALDMKEKLKKLLDKQADEKVQKSYRDQIIEHLLEKYPFDLPKTLLQKETQFRIKQLLNDTTSQKKLMSMDDKEKKDTFEHIQKQSQRAIRLLYISRKILKEQQISINPNEIDQSVKTPLEAIFNDQFDHYSVKKEPQEQKAIAMSRLILKKAEDFLISKAKIVPKIEEKDRITNLKEEDKSPTK